MKWENIRWKYWSFCLLKWMFVCACVIWIRDGKFVAILASICNMCIWMICVTILVWYATSTRKHTDTRHTIAHIHALRVRAYFSFFFISKHHVKCTNMFIIIIKLYHRSIKMHTEHLIQMHTRTHNITNILLLFNSWTEWKIWWCTFIQ